jgi:hypothetical protein
MAIGDDGMSRAVARCRSLDPYSLWRALKDLENEIYSIKRANEPIPIEMIRMRAVLLRARGKKADPSASISAAPQVAFPESVRHRGKQASMCLTLWTGIGPLEVCVWRLPGARMFASSPGIGILRRQRSFGTGASRHCRKMSRKLSQPVYWSSDVRDPRRDAPNGVGHPVEQAFDLSCSGPGNDTEQGLRSSRQMLSGCFSSHLVIWGGGRRSHRPDTKPVDRTSRLWCLVGAMV